MFQNGEFLKDFNHIVEGLDTFAANEQFSFYLDPQLITFYDDKLFLQNKDCNKFLLTERRRKINKKDYNGEFLLSKVAKNQMVAKQDLNNKTLNSLIAYLFFYSVIPSNPYITKQKLVSKIEYLTTINPQLPLELTDLIKNGIAGNIDKTPVRYFGDIVNCFKNSINKQCENKVVEHEISAYTQTGLNKRFNEDIIYTLKHKGSSILVVSDGVTNSDIGQGGLVSSIILSKLRTEESRFKRLFDKLSNLTNSYEEWSNRVESTLIKLLNRINEKIIKEVNNLIQSEEIDDVDNQSIMSAGDILVG